MVARMTGAEAEILTIAVEPARRREGIGRALCEKLVALLRARGATRMVLEVGVQNKGARRLYDGLGFSTVGKRPAYYGKVGTKHREDALIMALQLAESGPP
jgi:ribosomal-protein-alanine N-acetyltransferase